MSNLRRPVTPKGFGRPDPRDFQTPRFRDPRNPRHLEPDHEGYCPPDPRDRLYNRLKDATFPDGRPVVLRPDRDPDIVINRGWNSVALFFNLVAARRPGDYRETTAADVRNWLDEGDDAADPTISAFLESYWSTLSYGRLQFRMNTPRALDGTPLVPTVDVDPNDWGGLITAILDQNAEAIWRAAGGMRKPGKRVIPSIVLVQRYSVQATAAFGGFDRTVGGAVYEVGDITHLSYNLAFAQDPRLPANRSRWFWMTVCHEFGHNFLEFTDLYGPQGCTGYWDLLGDNLAPHVMSEVSSVHKHRIGWLRWKETIEGPTVPLRALSLRPYTTTGEAYKVVPDPQHNPSEFFTLEYRKSTGPEPWRPDGGLREEGLLVTHFNVRFGGPASTWLLREAPYYDPEFADASERGSALWTGWDRLTGVLFPQGERNAFTPSTQPGSHFYGGRPSGLSITDIRVEGGEVRFNLSINCRAEVGWTVGDADRAVAGRFSAESAAFSAAEGQELFLRNDRAAALVFSRQAQFFVAGLSEGRIDGWSLGPGDKETVGDLDGDGRDEIFIRSAGWAGVLKWDRGAFRAVTVQGTRIDGWALGPGDRHLAADLDGDNSRELYTRSDGWAGVLRLVRMPGGAWRLAASSVQGTRVDNWVLGNRDRELVGRFTQATRDEILIRSSGWLGLLSWDAGDRLLHARAVTGPRVDGWALGPGDREVVGDFDGDGLDEVYIRSAGWAGVFKWQGDRFRVLWMREGDLRFLAGDTDRLSLAADDVSYAGRFLPDRAGVMHRGADGILSLLSWEGGEMKVRIRLRPADNGWNLATTDKFVLGDFHRVGMDVGDPTLDFVTDRLTDIFIHNSWGTGMVGLNRLPDGRDQFGVTWVNAAEILLNR